MAAVSGHSLVAETGGSASGSSPVISPAAQTLGRCQDPTPATLEPDQEDAVFMPARQFTEQGNHSRPSKTSQYRRLNHASLTCESGSRSPPLCRRWI